MELEGVHSQLQELTLPGLVAITGSSIGVEGCKKSIAYYATGTPASASHGAAELRSSGSHASITMCGLPYCIPKC